MNFIKEKNSFNRNVIKLQSGNAFLIGDGYTKNGQFPFVDKINIKDFKKIRIFESQYTDKFESIIDFNPSNNELFVRIESAIDFPNYFIKKIFLKNNYLQESRHVFSHFQDENTRESQQHFLRPTRLFAGSFSAQRFCLRRSESLQGSEHISDS